MNSGLSTSYRFSLRVKTRMPSEELETRLQRVCQAAYTFSLEGLDEVDGESFKIMMLTFISEADREAFKKSMRGG